MYDEQILKILLDVGVRGISTKKLAKHVYNHFCTFFYQPDFDEVYRYVYNYLKRNSRSPKGIIEHAEKRGHYRLNAKNQSAFAQLSLEFGKDQQVEEEETVTSQQDCSLSLFD